jgi:hypothetical protein
MTFTAESSAAGLISACWPFVPDYPGMLTGCSVRLPPSPGKESATADKGTAMVLVVVEGAQERRLSPTPGQQPSSTSAQAPDEPQLGCTQTHTVTSFLPEVRNMYNTTLPSALLR